MKKSSVYHNAVLLEGPELKIQEDAYIVIEEGKISSIGTGSPYGGTDLKGAIVFPSFVNAHTHIADSIVKEGGVGLSTEAAVSPPNGLKYKRLRDLSPEALEGALSHAITELLINGITAFADYREGGKEGSHILRKVVDNSPIEAVIFGEPDCQLGSDEYIEEAESVLEIADGMGIGDIASYSDDALGRLKALHFQAGKRLAIHVGETKNAQKRCLQLWGKSEIYRALDTDPALFIHFTNPEQEDIERTAKSGIPVVCCVRTNCILADGIPPLHALVKKGIPLSLGTDNMMFTSPDMFREMDWFSRLARGESDYADAVTPQKVLSIATLGGAQALGIDNRLGSLEVGKTASFIALNSRSANLRGITNIHSAIVHRAGPADIQLVVSQGTEVTSRVS